MTKNYGKDRYAESPKVKGEEGPMQDPEECPINTSTCTLEIAGKQITAKTGEDGRLVGLDGEPFTVHPLVIDASRQLAVLVPHEGGYRKVAKANATVTLRTGEACPLGDVVVQA
ncbi:MAG: hypothetical protein Q8R70_09375 [Methanoregula sp.]|nr:hypothetical protein [Methanoregula sp.]